MNLQDVSERLIDVGLAGESEGLDLGLSLLQLSHANCHFTNDAPPQTSRISLTFSTTTSPTTLRTTSIVSDVPDVLALLVLLSLCSRPRVSHNIILCLRSGNR